MCARKEHSRVKQKDEMDRMDDKDDDKSKTEARGNQ
jgi:hypothetical protein